MSPELIGIIVLGAIVLAAAFYFLHSAKGKAELATVEANVKGAVSQVQGQLSTAVSDIKGHVTATAAANAPVAPPSPVPAPVAPPVAAPPPVNVRTIPGGSTGYVGSPQNNLPAYQAAGSPYTDLNGVPLTNAGAWATVPATAQADPYVWNGAAFAAANGTWMGFPSKSAAPYSCTVQPGNYAIQTTSQGAGNFSCTFGAFPTNGDTFNVAAATEVVLVPNGAAGTVQLYKR